MASPSFFRSSPGRGLPICARCAFRASRAPSRATRRWITGMELSKEEAKFAEAEAYWKESAAKIRSGQKRSMLDKLESRGLVKTIAGNREMVDKMMTDKRVGAYVGIDPTASSLHVGHMAPLMIIFWMYVHGYPAVSLVGGATATIGDPTDRLTTRENEDPVRMDANMEKMHIQLRALWRNVDAYARKHRYWRQSIWHRELLNNHDWWNKLPMLDVLQILGPGMRLGSMLARDTVKNKMQKGDGMSYSEFSYPLMQAWDWWHMFHKKGIQMQVGGSDQFGNITAGINAIKHISKHHPDPMVREKADAVGEPFGLTVPILTTASGQKFGKSAGNAIWLDGEQTSTFDLYGYFLRTSDNDVGKYLKMFTFIPLRDIATLVDDHMKAPWLRKAQHALAREFVELVHGSDEARHAESQHRLIFGQRTESTDSDATVKVIRPTANIKLPRTFVFQKYKKTFGKLLYAVGLSENASHGNRLIREGGIYVALHQYAGKNPLDVRRSLKWRRISIWEPEDGSKYLVHGDLLCLRRSKYDVRIVQVVSDEEYLSSGETFPGMVSGWENENVEAERMKQSVAQKEATAAKLLEEEAESAEGPLVSDEQESKESVKAE